MKIVVAPLAGARIEMTLYILSRLCLLSLPSRERGLKSNHRLDPDKLLRVAPLAGARIEISPSTGIMAMT